MTPRRSAGACSIMARPSMRRRARLAWHRFGREQTFELEQPDAKGVVFSQWVRTHELIIRRLQARNEGHVRHASVLAFKKSLAAGVLDGGESDIFLHGMRLSKFMSAVDEVSGSMGSAETAAPVSAEPAPAPTAVAAPSPAIAEARGDGSPETARSSVPEPWAAHRMGLGHRWRVIARPGATCSVAPAATRDAGATGAGGRRPAGAPAARRRPVGAVSLDLATLWARCCKPPCAAKQRHPDADVAIIRLVVRDGIPKSLVAPGRPANASRRHPGLLRWTLRGQRSGTRYRLLMASALAMYGDLLRRRITAG